MLKRVDRDTRFQISEVSSDLIKPFRRVVAAAMLRLSEERRTDSYGKKHVYLKSEENRVYEITDVNTKDTAHGRKTSTGLFVEGIQLDENGNPTEELVPIQLPRDQRRTDAQTLFSQRGSDPTDVQRLADEIIFAGRITAKEYANLLFHIRSRE